MATRAFIVVRSTDDDTDEQRVTEPTTLVDADLTTQPGKSLHQAIKQYVRTASAGAEVLPDDVAAERIRHWARKTGYPIGGTGRIPDAVLEDFYADPANAEDEPAEGGDDDGDKSTDDGGPPGQTLGGNVVELRPRPEPEGDTPPPNGTDHR